MSMKKRIIALILVAVMALTVCAAVIPAALAEEDEIAVLTAEKWVNATNISFIIHSNGTMDYDAGNLKLTGTWTYQSPNFVFNYELYGNRTIELVLENKDGQWMLTNGEGALFMHESVFSSAQQDANAGVTGYQLAIGEKVTLPFVSFTIEAAELVDIIGGDRSYYPAPEGFRLFRLRGTIENLFSGDLKISTLRSQFTLNDQYTYNGAVRAYLSNGLQTVIPAMTSGEISIYAEIPDAMAEQLKKADVVFSFNEDFAKAPVFVADGAYIFEVKVDEQQTAAAKDGPSFERVTFTECPILPTPQSYAEVMQSGSNKSSRNGKVTKIKYTFKLRSNRGNIKELRELYLQKVQEEGFTVKDSGAEAVVSWGKKKLATITISGDSISFDLVPGNDQLKADSQKSTPAGGEEKETVYKTGETIHANTADIKLEKKYSTGKKVFSNKTGKGSHHYYEYKNDPFFIIYGSFTNTGKIPVDVYNIYAAVIIDNEYSYRADVRGVSKKATNFVSDVSPQSSTECVIYAEIPSNILKKAKSIVVKLGFTDDFAIKVVSSGSLPLFENCDQVFEIKVK